MILKTLKWLLILVLVLGVAFLIYVLVKINHPAATQADEQLFEVPTGYTTKQIAKKLEGEGLIENAFFFELYIDFRDQGERVQAGSYVLSANMSIPRIAEILTTGQAVFDIQRFTVIEGWSVSQIAKKLEEQGIIERADDLSALRAADFAEEFDFLADTPTGANLEGFLFPDTYFFEENDGARIVARKMLDNFDRKLARDLRGAIEDTGKNIFEIVTMASIVEREVGRNVIKGTKLNSEDISKLQEERELVASVFYNRLDRGIRLESDATVGYVTGSNSNRSTLEELQIDSLYNTYKYTGLPPGPIASPSLDAVRAALDPAETDYLFFLTDEAGNAYFAESFEGHQQNRARYLD